MSRFTNKIALVPDTFTLAEPHHACSNAVEQHFGELVRLSPSERKRYLDSLASDEDSLANQLRELLDAHENAGSFLDDGDLGETTELVGQQLAGARIGRYKLREPIGEGGMGVVYVAEQERPIRRKVALKIIKPGMDSKQVLARFAAERQALALMDHPHIAKVLDAGSTEQGRPYFVMELIQGQSITDYCDEKKLSIDERLKLFAQVCHAVQHAHQKGIIHRDLKPSNVLITEIDGQAVPKVIDFGVAKALSASLTEQTVYTSFQTLVGTPLYMSPEQAKLSGVDVDTRSDVYSLGVLLYELLTGTVPFDKGRLKQAALDEVCRIIREEEPPTPSQRLSTLGDSAADISKNRGTEPTQLARTLRHEPSWIVGKAMDKDRNRRYATALALAEDVEHHLADEPISAGRPSSWNRTRRYVRNQWKVLAFASTFLFIAVYSTWQSYRYRELLEKYESELRSQTLVAIFSGDRREAQRKIDDVAESTMEDGWRVLFSGLLKLYHSEPAQAELERATEMLRKHRRSCGTPAGAPRGRIRSSILRTYR